MAGKTVSVRTIAHVTTLAPGAAGSPYESVFVSFGAVIWRSVRVIIPTGHAALTSIAFYYAQQQIVPWEDDTNPLFGLPGDYTFPVNLEIDNRIDIWAINRDVYYHDFYCFFEVEDVVSGLQPQTVTAVPL